MPLLLRFDRLQLSVADATMVAAWRWLGLSRRMLLNMLLIGMLLSQVLAQIAQEGRVEALTLGLAAFLLLLMAAGARQPKRSLQLQRAAILMYRARRLPTFLRLAVWPWTLYVAATSLKDVAAPLELMADLFLLAAMILGHALPSDEAPPPRRRRKAARAAAAPIRFGAGA